MTSNRLQLNLDDSGRVTSVYQCVGGTPITGANLLATTTPYFATETDSSGVVHNPTSFTYNSGTGTLTFGGFPNSGTLTMTVAQGTAHDYMTFNVTAKPVAQSRLMC